MHNFNKTKLGLCVLGVSVMLFASSQAMAFYYTMGPYLNVGAGGLTIVANGHSSTGGAARAGLGYIEALDYCDVNPLFLGIEANGDYGYTDKFHSIYGADISGIIGKVFEQEMSIFGKLGANGIGQDSSYVFGPQVGVGLGFQVLPLLKVAVEGDYALDAFHTHDNHDDFVGHNTANTFTYLLGLQYTLYPTNPPNPPMFVQIPE
jgi:hypothetical protein